VHRGCVKNLGGCTRLTIREGSMHKKKTGWEVKRRGVEKANSNGPTWSQKPKTQNYNEHVLYKAARETHGK